MKFSYKRIPISPTKKQKFTKHVLRPVIPIRVKHKGRAIGYEALIDSGADYCIFHSELAEIMGIAWDKGEIVSLGGVGGKKFKGRFSKVKISVGGNEIETKVLFSDDIPDFGYAILGQVGFFEFFRIRFIYQKGEIQIKAERLLN